MDKSLGTNLHLWHFYTRAKQTVTHEFIYTCLAPLPPTMLETCTNISPEFQHCFWGEGGKATHFEKDNSVFF